MHIKMIYNKATFKHVFKYQMAKLNAKLQLLLSIRLLNVHWKKTGCYFNRTEDFISHDKEFKFFL